jgi:CBS domain-containing protein
MDIEDIATQEYLAVDVEERLGKVRSVFERDNPKGIIATDDGDYAGVVTERQLMGSHVEDDTKVGALLKPGRSRKQPATAPRVDRDDDVREVARVLVESGSKVAPVFEGEDLWGIVTADVILSAVVDNLDVLTVEEIHTAEVVTVGEDATIGKAVNNLRENGISRVPVVNENGRLAGMVTTHDLIDVVVRDMDKTTRGDRSGEVDRVLDLPVYDVMNSPVATIDVGSSVAVAVRRMLDNDYGGLVVTPEGKDDVIAGVLTKTDVLRALTYTAEDHMDVQITNVALLDTLGREEIRASLEDVVDKFQEMQVQHAHVRFTEHKEKLRGTPLVYAQIRLRTSHGQVAGSGEGYGAETAFRVALDKLERNVLELKGIRADEEYEGQLLRKLGEL